MTVEAVLEHGLNAKVANGRLTVDGDEPLDLALSEVVSFRYERAPYPDVAGALVLRTVDGDEYLLRVCAEDAPAFINVLREPPLDE